MHCRKKQIRSISHRIRRCKNLIKRDYVIVGMNRSSPPPNETLSVTLTPDPAESGIPSMSIILRREDYDKLNKPTIGDKVTLTISLASPKEN